MLTLNLKFWMLLHRGDHSCPPASLQLLKESTCHIDINARSILMHAVYDSKDQIGVGLLSNRNLGLVDGATETETFEQALGLGLCKLPHWAAPALCWARQARPLGRRILVATEPIKEHIDGVPWFLGIDGYDLYAVHASAKGYWGDEKLFLFGVPSGLQFNVR